jgi:hypothetical protein
MTTVEILTITALAGGPVASVLVSLVFEARRQDQAAKRHVLHQFMLARAHPWDPLFQAAINMVPIAFRRDQKVLAAWEGYLAAVGKPVPEDGSLRDVIIAEQDKANNALCEALLLALRFNKRDANTMVRSLYSSVGFAKLQNIQITALTSVPIIADATQRLAKANESLIARIPTEPGKQVEGNNNLKSEG